MPADPSRREPPVPGDATVLPDDAVLAELTAPVALEDARESLAFWRGRLDELPLHKRAERKEAQDAIERWETKVRDAERAQYGPSVLEQVLGALGVVGARARARGAGVEAPPFRWRLTAGPWFDNQVATLTLDGPTSRLAIDRAPATYPAPPRPAPPRDRARPDPGAVGG